MRLIFVAVSLNDGDNENARDDAALIARAVNVLRGEARR